MQDTDLGELIFDVHMHDVEVDPIALLSTIPAHRAAMFWRHADTWWVAQGCALSHTPTSTHDWDGVRDIRARLARACPPQVLGRLKLVGGFAFDPLCEHHGLWKDFGPMALWLPEQLVEFDGTHTHVVHTSTSASGDEPNDWLNSPRLRGDEPCVHARPDTKALQWGALVDRAAALLHDDPLWQKVVLARIIEVHGSHPFYVDNVIEHLSQAYPTCKIFAVRPPGATSWFVGATPECLVRAKARSAYVDALAGTAAPSLSDEAFLASAKDRDEHQLVIDAIEHDLKPLGPLDVPTCPSVDRLPNVSHLRTPIRATLQHGDFLDATQRLHPTPAVCGLPRKTAHAFIKAHEGLERGWYTGCVGWVDAQGDGEWDVALRCALIDGKDATIFSGAGIVAASQGHAEIEETRLKAQAMLGALGV